jgi:hypothetical protein
MKSEIERFPRLFAGVETVPGLTWPTMVFERDLTLFLGTLEVRLKHIGPGHTKGDKSGACRPACMPSKVWRWRFKLPISTASNCRPRSRK